MYLNYSKDSLNQFVQLKNITSLNKESFISSFSHYFYKTILKDLTDNYGYSYDEFTIEYSRYPYLEYARLKMRFDVSDRVQVAYETLDVSHIFEFYEQMIHTFKN